MRASMRSIPMQPAIENVSPCSGLTCIHKYFRFDLSILPTQWNLEGRQMKQCWIKYIKKNQKNPQKIACYRYFRENGVKRNIYDHFLNLFIQIFHRFGSWIQFISGSGIGRGFRFRSQAGRKIIVHQKRNFFAIPCLQSSLEGWRLL